MSIPCRIDLLRGWPLQSLVPTGLRDPDDATGDLDRGALGDDHFRRREPPFGSAVSFSSSRARLLALSSVSRSVMRLRAATSSAFFAEVSPGASPLSILSWRRQT